jgi:hypothetical protein
MIRISRLVTAVLLAAPFTAAHGDIVFVGTVSINGTGLGAVNTVLTIQSKANNTAEQGCVTPTSNGSAFSTGNLVGNLCSIGSNDDLKTGASQTLTRNLLDVGILSGSAFGIIFNASEPGGNSISLDNLVAYFMNTSGQTFSANLFCGSECDFASTQEGTGKSGALFMLNNTQAASLQTFITNSGGAGNVYVGLGAAAGNKPGFEATGGLETFFVFNAVQGVTFSIVPEPSTTVLATTGFLGLALIARRRRRA